MKQLGRAEFEGSVDGSKGRIDGVNKVHIVGGIFQGVLRLRPSQSLTPLLTALLL